MIHRFILAPTIPPINNRIDPIIPTIVVVSLMLLEPRSSSINMIMNDGIINTPTNVPVMHIARRFRMSRQHNISADDDDEFYMDTKDGFSNFTQ